MFYEDDLSHEREMAGREWASLAERFTNDGYREGITAGKEAASQVGFDEGFATVGVPVGRKLGSLRGIVNGLLLYLTALLPQQRQQELSPTDLQAAVEETRDIVRRLDALQLQDVAPPDMEAIAHAREHGLDDDAFVGNGGETEHLTQAFASLSTTDGAERMMELSARLDHILARLGVQLHAFCPTTNGSA